MIFLNFMKDLKMHRLNDEERMQHTQPTRCIKNREFLIASIVFMIFGLAFLLPGLIVELPKENYRQKWESGFCITKNITNINGNINLDYETVPSLPYHSYSKIFNCKPYDLGCQYSITDTYKIDKVFICYYNPNDDGISFDKRVKDQTFEWILCIILGPVFIFFSIIWFLLSMRK
jgi:hypothetical protein